MADAFTVKAAFMTASFADFNITFTSHETSLADLEKMLSSRVSLT